MTQVTITFESLWGDLKIKDKPQTPNSLLEEQAFLLSKATGFRLQGKIITSSLTMNQSNILGFDRLYLIKRFVIKTETRGRYSLFTVTLPKEAPYFPLFFFEGDPSYEKIHDLKILEDKVAAALGSEENKKLIEELLEYELEAELEVA